MKKWIMPKGMSINGVRRFSAIFDLPKYLPTNHVRRFLLYNVQYLGPFLDPLPNLKPDLFYEHSITSLGYKKYVVHLSAYALTYHNYVHWNQSKHKFISKFQQTKLKNTVEKSKRLTFFDLWARIFTFFEKQKVLWSHFIILVSKRGS